jgi:methionyl-tRNA formyltransferase
VKVLFWGTPAFALPALRALAEEGHDVVASSRSRTGRRGGGVPSPSRS